VTCDDATLALGAYVLGALEPEERRWVEEHLRTCPGCAAEREAFASLPALLDRVRPEELEPVVVAPPPDLFARMSAAAAGAEGRRPHRNRSWLLAAAAVLVALVVGVTSWVIGSRPDTVTATAGPVRATVTASSTEGGSALDVTVAGLRPGEECRLVAVDEDGERHDAGSWPTSEDGDGRWVGWADVDRSALAGVVLLGEGGRELVRMPL